METLRGHTTGFAIPVYVLDTPFGKVPLDRSWVVGRSGDHVVMRTTRGEIWAEPNPLSPEEAGYLPSIAMPEEAHTVATGQETRDAFRVVSVRGAG